MTHKSGYTGRIDRYVAAITKIDRWVHEQADLKLRVSGLLELGMKHSAHTSYC